MFKKTSKKSFFTRVNKTLFLFGLSMLSVFSFFGIFFISFSTSVDNVYAKAPSFTKDMGEKLINVDGNDVEENGRMFKWDIDKDKTLKENILSLFYPEANGEGGQIWNFFRIIMYAVITGAIIYVGILFVRDADGGIDKAKEYTKKITYVLLGGALILLSTYILGSALDIGKGSDVFVKGLENNFLFQILAFLKGFAFFFAIIFLIRNGYVMMRTTEGDENLKKGKDGVLAVIVSLVFIKIIDYIYYVAQSPNLKQQATDLIVESSKMLAYLVGAFAIIMIFYGGFRLITDGGKGKGFDVFKKVIVGTVISAIVIFLFLLIMYQVIQEFA